jgi:hypothetical protein
MFFTMGGQHTIQNVKVNYILQFFVVFLPPIALVVSLKSFNLIHYLISLEDIHYGRYQR